MTTKRIERVLRGGSWLYSAEECRSVLRGWDELGWRFNLCSFRPAFRLKRIKR